MKIIKAAIIQNGIIYVGINYEEIIKNSISKGFHKGEPYTEGFYTDKRDFVNKEEAAIIAFENNQIEELKTELSINDIQMK